MSILSETPLHTPLYAYHLAAKARMVPFAGYEMPLSYEGIVAEHLYVRSEGKAGLFDVSHMGQVIIEGLEAEAALEKIISVDLTLLPPHKIKYSVLLNADGGVVDDLMISRLGEHKFFLVVNAGCLAKDLNYLHQMLPSSVTVTQLKHALVALQGKAARKVISEFWQDAGGLHFMQNGWFSYKGEELLVSCCGYTGEDGFEVSIPIDCLDSFIEQIFHHDCVRWIGLGARDSLRLEAGLALYGHELTEQISPIEAGLKWVFSPKHRGSFDYVGKDVIHGQITQGASRKLVGLLPVGRQPVRENTELYDVEGGRKIGWVTSGGFSPVLEKTISMAYIQGDFAQVTAIVRGKPILCDVTTLPFVKHNYFKG